MAKRLERWLNEVLFTSTLFLGPGMILAVQLSGRRFSEAFHIGGEYGLSLLWAITIVMVFKYCLAEGLTRYTLAKGEDIFTALGRLPGPRNWGMGAISIVYTLELATYAGVTLLAATAFLALAPLGLSAVLMAVICLVAIMGVLYLKPWSFIERLASVVIVLVGIILVYCLVAALMQVPFSEVVASHSGTYQAEDIFLIMTGSGSGLSLLLFSLWVRNRVPDKVPQQEYRKVFNGVRLGILLAFVFTLFIIITLMIISSAIGTGLSSGSGSTSLADSTQQGLDELLLGPQLFLFATFLMMVCAVLIGTDGRARAISGMLKRSGTVGLNKENLYKIMLALLLAIIAAAIMLGRPQDIVNFISALSSVVFAVTGFILIYLNRKLPDYARAGWAWTIVMLAGSSAFLVLSIVSERTFMEFGLPMLLRVLVLMLIIYMLARLGTLGWMVRNVHRWRGAFLMIFVFSLVSILGTEGGVRIDGYIINFRDLGPMMAGILGGPIVGALVGLIGGSYRYGYGGWTALPCFVATVSAGAVSGLVMMYWKGKASYLKVIALGILVECMHIFLYLPLLTPGAPFTNVMDTMRNVTVPMIVTNVLGLIMFLYVLEQRHVNTFRGALPPDPGAVKDSVAVGEGPDRA